MKFIHYIEKIGGVDIFGMISLALRYFFSCHAYLGVQDQQKYLQ